MSPSATGTTTVSRLAARCWFSNCSPGDAVAGREGQFLYNEGLGLFDETDQIAAADVGDDHAVATAHFSIDLDGTGGTFELGDAGQDPYYRPWS